MMTPVTEQSSPFSLAIRASVCLHCAQPVVGPDAGTVACPRCGQAIPLEPRARFLRPGSAPFPGPQPPMFRAQDGKPLLPPPGIAFLWEGNDIPAHREAEALVAWQGARRRAAAMDVGAGEELCMLTRALALKAENAGDLPRARALAEASLEAVPLPRQRATLLGMLARAAVRAGDPGSGAAWLSCFEVPQELESDSEHRITSAVVATAHGDCMAALHALGNRYDQVAIVDALDPMAVILRVNALEKLGHTAEATQQLQELLGRGPDMRDAVARIRQPYHRMALCELTMPHVQAAHEQRARAAAGRGRITMGYFLMGMSALPLSLLLISGIFVPSALATCLIVALPFVFFGFKMVRMGQRERHVFTHGVRAPARVLGAAPTGTSINRVPELRIDLEAQLIPPVRTSIRLLVHPGQHHILVPGTMLHVRVDPNNPGLAILDQ
jgi:hypothetical protein